MVHVKWDLNLKKNIAGQSNKVEFVDPEEFENELSEDRESVG
jgi:hypothetical protein